MGDSRSVNTIYISCYMMSQPDFIFLCCLFAAASGQAREGQARWSATVLNLVVGGKPGGSQVLNIVVDGVVLGRRHDAQTESEPSSQNQFLH